MKFKWKIFFIAFVFSLVASVVSISEQYLQRAFHFSFEVLAWISFGIDVFAFFVSPALLFAIFYFVGRKIDLSAQFQSVLVSLFLGCWFGHLLGYLPLQFEYLVLYGGTLFGPPGFVRLPWYVLRQAFSLEFFATVAALSIAYILRNIRYREVYVPPS